MKNTRSLCVLGALTLLTPATLTAQVGVELAVVGGLASGTALKYGLGGNLALLVPNAPLSIGARFLRHWSDATGSLSGSTLVTEENDATGFFGELGLRTDLSGIEVGATLNAGVAKYTQARTPRGDTTRVSESTEFTFAPGIVGSLPLGPIRLGAEIHYFIGGDPGFATTFDNRDFIFYFRWSYRFGGRP